MAASALVQAFLAGLSALAGSGVESRVATLTPREKAALVVVSGQPAPPGVAGVFVRPWDRHLRRPRGALVFVDQEGGTVKGFPELPPWRAAAEYRSAWEALSAARETARALRQKGVNVDLAPVLDLPDGPLGSRHFRAPSFAVAFARGLARGGVAGCAKHFPGLGSAPVSTDEAPRVRARVRARELAAFHAAIRAGVPCVMTSHALYDRFGGARALVSSASYRLLRRLGFRGVAITDSLSVVRGRWPVSWAVRAVRAGADLVLFTSPADARAAIDALVPLARAGALDRHVARVLRLRRRYGS